MFNLEPDKIILNGINYINTYERRVPNKNEFYFDSSLGVVGELVCNSFKKCREIKTIFKVKE